MQVMIPDENGVKKEIEVATIAENIDQYVTEENKPLVVELIKLIANMEEDRVRIQRTGDELNGKIRHLDMANRHYMTLLSDFHRQVEEIKDLDTNPQLEALRKFATNTKGIRNSLSVLLLNGKPSKKRMLQIMHQVFKSAQEGQLSSVSIVGLNEFVTHDENQWLLQECKEACDEQ